MQILTDNQIEFIRQDIINRGITEPELQENILDHVCCILEEELNNDSEFENMYELTIRKFYANQLSEIEEEALLLLKYKNYYAMRKLMIYSGAISVCAFFLGSLFKIMHWPAASVLLILAIFTICFIFFPILLLFRVKETNSTKEKTVIAVGIITGILFCTGVLFRIMHWPGSYYLWVSAIALSFLVFTPLFYFTNINKPERKINTLVTTILIVLATGIQFSLININPSRNQSRTKTYIYIQGQQMVDKLRAENVPMNTPAGNLKTQILNTSEEIKKLILQNTINLPSVPSDFESRHIYIDENNLGNSFINNSYGFNLLTKLNEEIKSFNDLEKNNKNQIDYSITAAVDDNITSYSNVLALNSINQLELYVLVTPHEN